MTAPKTLVLTVVLAAVGVAFAEPCPDVDADQYADCTVSGCEAGALPCGDCDDADANRNPGETEICNHVDDDCDGVADDGFDKPAMAVYVFDPQAGSSDRFGHALANLGDVSGDGVDDFVVGTPWKDQVYPLTNLGEVALVSGATREIVCRAHHPGAAAADYLGFSVDAIGDLTGDGICDFAAGAYYDDNPRGTDAGSVFLFSGADCSWVRTLVDDDGQAQDWLGYSVAGLGDLNGDGVPDVAAGATRDDWGTLNSAGSVVVFSGADGAAIRKLTDPAGEGADEFGQRLIGLGDIDGDGVGDLAVGVPLQGPVNFGRVVLFSGATGNHIRTLEDGANAEGQDYFGESVAGIADVNGDGVPDVLVGVVNDDDGGRPLDTGKVVIVSGADGTVIRTLTDPDGWTSDRLGASVADAGDRNGDGVPDVIAGAREDDVVDGVATNEGSVILFSGADGAVIRKFFDPNALDGDMMGRTVASIGDLSGDGEPEILASVWEEYANGEIEKIVVFSLEADCDEDGLSPYGGDCDDADSSVWGRPSEARDVRFASEKTVLSWTEPAEPGGTAAVTYDTLRSAAPGSFGEEACFDSGAYDTSTEDVESPAAGSAFFYLVRAENSCGDGSLGSWGGLDWPREAATCP